MFVFLLNWVKIDNPTDYSLQDTRIVLIGQEPVCPRLSGKIEQPVAGSECCIENTSWSCLASRILQKKPRGVRLYPINNEGILNCVLPHFNQVAMGIASLSNPAAFGCFSMPV
jgi:hypothetical protein